MPAQALAGVQAAALYYPWCSGPILGIELLKAADADWDSRIPLLVFQADRDTLSDTALCEAILQRHRAKGQPIESITYSGTLHGFDGTYGSPEDPNLAYNAVAAAQSRKAMVAFFGRHLR